MEDSTLGRMQEATVFLEPLHSILAEAVMPGLLEAFKRKLARVLSSLRERSTKLNVQ